MNERNREMMQTVEETLRRSHEDLEDERERTGLLAPFARPLPVTYSRRKFVPLHVTDGGNTVVRFATAWEWGQHLRGDFSDPIEMMRCVLIEHKPTFKLCGARPVRFVEHPGAWHLHGNFETYSAGFDIVTTNEILIGEFCEAFGCDLAQ